MIGDHRKGFNYRYMLKELLQKNRSYRRFYQDTRIAEQELAELVELTGLCPSGRNAQALKYVIVNDLSLCEKVFETLAWAGYLTDWAGPSEGERPSAYLIQLLDTTIVENCLCDDGIQAQTVMLGAVEKGLGGCIIKAFKNEELRNILHLPERLRIMYVLALGKPKEHVVIDEIKDGDFKYWREPDGTHHVPKRSVNELIFVPEGLKQ